MRLAIKSGHLVGVDPGAVGNGLQEAEVVDIIQNECVDTLRKVYGLDVLDSDKLYKDDVIEINSMGADYAIEIHLNSHTTLAAGFETIVYPDPKSLSLQDKLHSRLYNDTANLEITSIDRGKKQRSDLYFLSKTKCPAMIVEVVFINNPTESRKVKTFAKALGIRYGHSIAKALGFTPVNIIQTVSNENVATLAIKTINGRFGNGRDRVVALGDLFNSVQKVVDYRKGKCSRYELLNTLVNETLKGRMGNGDLRKNRLGEYYVEVQRKINGR